MVTCVISPVKHSAVSDHGNVRMLISSGAFRISQTANFGHRNILCARLVVFDLLFLSALRLVIGCF